MTKGQLYTILNNHGRTFTVLKITNFTNKEAEMAETIEREKWHWFNVMEDLQTQGGLDGVFIDPLSVGEHGCGGKTRNGTIFYITRVANKFLLVSMTQDEKDLIDAFAKVVEYRPFCQYYNRVGQLTFEWDKVDPDGRFVKLEKDDEKTCLCRVQ
ncbi:MAG: hypothetical protein AAB678_00875 [Patescibacteria group bacterium]